MQKLIPKIYARFCRDFTFLNAVARARLCRVGTGLSWERHTRWCDVPRRLTPSMAALAVGAYFTSHAGAICNSSLMKREVLH